MDRVQYGVVNVTQNNKSIKFNDATMYYFNKKGYYCLRSTAWKNE